MPMKRYKPEQIVTLLRQTEALIELASEYGRYGYRRITALLQDAGWQIRKLRPLQALIRDR